MELNAVIISVIADAFPFQNPAVAYAHKCPFGADNLRNYRGFMLQNAHFSNHGNIYQRHGCKL